jgi:hypothetical protein
MKAEAMQPPSQFGIPTSPLSYDKPLGVVLDSQVHRAT